MILIPSHPLLVKLLHISITAIRVAANGPISHTLAFVRALSSSLARRATRLKWAFPIILGEEDLLLSLTDTANSTSSLDVADSWLQLLTLWHLIAFAPCGLVGTCRATHEDVY